MKITVYAQNQWEEDDITEGQEASRYQKTETWGQPLLNS